MKWHKVINFIFLFLNNIIIKRHIHPLQINIIVEKTPNLEMLCFFPTDHIYEKMLQHLHAKNLLVEQNATL